MIDYMKKFITWTLTEPQVNSRMLYAFTSTVLGICLLYLVAWFPFLKNRDGLDILVGLVISGFLAVATGRYITKKGQDITVGGSPDNNGTPTP
jgi:hypothetical protein